MERAGRAGDRAEMAHGLDNGETGAHRTLGIILAGAWISKVNQYTVTHVAGDEPAERYGQGSDGLVICGGYGAQVLRIQPRTEQRRVDEIGKQHGELSPLRSRAAIFTRSYSPLEARCRRAAFAAKPIARRILACAGLTTPRQRRSTVSAIFPAVFKRRAAERANHGPSFPMARGPLRRLPLEDTLPTLPIKVTRASLLVANPGQARIVDIDRDWNARQSCPRPVAPGF